MTTGSRSTYPHTKVLNLGPIYRADLAAELIKRHANHYGVVLVRLAGKELTFCREEDITVILHRIHMSGGCRKDAKGIAK